MKMLSTVVAVFIIKSWKESSSKLRRLGLLLNKIAPVIEVKFYRKEFHILSLK